MLAMEQYDALDDAEKAAAILQGDFLANRERLRTRERNQLSDFIRFPVPF